MKKRIFLAALVATLTLSASAQQVNTLYFLENAPMRHTINPAFQPVSQGFINFTPLGWMSFGVGNNSLTMSDVLFVDPKSGMTITPLHPNADKYAFLRQMRSMTFVNGEATIGLLNMGFRVKEAGYVTIGINERMTGGATLPRSIFDFVLDGGMTDLRGGNNQLSLSGLGAGATLYTEISGGYSHKLNDEWTVGGKLKVLLGQAYMGINTKDLAINASTEQWNIYGTATLDIAAPINAAYLNSYIDGKNINQVIASFQDGTFDATQLYDPNAPVTDMVKNVLTPSGYGAAIDLGFTYKPIENLQITAALTDFGFIYWNRSNRFTCVVDTTFNGVGDINYGDQAYRDENGNFSTAILMDTVKSNMMGLLNGVNMHTAGSGFARMTSARLNIGVDANFWENRVGVGIVSATRLYNARLYEEITLGVAFRPFNWLNIAASYSLLSNGKYSNIGAGLSIMPYDGINLTLAMDYIPTTYAGMTIGQETKYIIPSKTKMVNVALGFSVCWGTNRRDKDKDGVWDKIDMCLDTPRGVEVDSVGCPIDTDHDGVPDYLDHCPNTPKEAIGFVDSVGCAMDSDGDGVEDYKDRCPNTPKAALGKVDSVGCPLDTDGDGVPDYLDECPETPAAAYGMIDAKGCPLDTDHDGVPDYRDACADTPAEARGMVDENGCPIDSDHDGVADYQDACPNTDPRAIGFVDAHGCELDSDGDGVPDYMDECPFVAGISANKGCPEIKREVRQLLQKAMQGIEFESGKATIKKKSYPLLDQIAQIFIENDNYIIEVQGHTDNTGNADVNKKLSEQRAIAVMQYLVNKGVAAERMTAVGYGHDVPIADNKTAAGRQKNRRVEFKITFEEVHIETILDHADEDGQDFGGEHNLESK
ncbi:MAG: OmpA family protein [Paludibacteraceae bacterium]|nr:OmpA family protein [Paludibacteraceae bacterium]MBQ5379458.1 OmpA family protein [Paludibacteraceae bacterium]